MRNYKKYDTPLSYFKSTAREATKNKLKSMCLGSHSNRIASLNLNTIGSRIVLHIPHDPFIQFLEGLLFLYIC